MMTPARIIPERLVERIQAAGLSYSAVARKMGVKQPTISRLAKGEQGSTGRIDQLARIVASSPAYLTGESDDPGPEGVLLQLTYEQRELLSCFDALSEKDRQLLLAMAMRMADRDGSSRIQNPRMEYRPER